MPAPYNAGQAATRTVLVDPLTALDAVPGQVAPLTGGVNRSGTAATSSGSLAAANPNRRGLTIQNIGANNIGVNEFGGAAAIGTAGTYTVVPGGSVSISTTNQVNVIAATGATPYTATEF